MRQIRFVGALAVALLVTGTALLATAPAAFAELVGPPEGGGGVAPTQTITHSGFSNWQTALIALGAAAFAAVVMRVRFRFQSTAQHSPAGS